MTKIACTSFILVTTIVLASCKKNTVSNHYISCTIDGIAETFNFKAKAYDTTFVNGTRQIGFSGYLNDSANSPLIDVTIYNWSAQNEISTEAYCDSSSLYDVFSDYYPKFTNSISDTVYNASKTTLNELAANSLVQNYFVLNITVISKTELKGTFSGNYYLVSNVKNTPQNITNGQFDLSF